MRGEDADNLAVLTDDTGSTSTSYTDSTVEADTTYAYAVRGRNAHGLGPQSEPVSVTTPAAPPEEDEPPTSARALAGSEFTLDGKDLDTDGTCNEDNIEDVSDDCTINIDTTTVIFAADGTLDSDDRIRIKIGRDKAAVDTASTVVDEDDIFDFDEEKEAELTFQAGRNLMHLWGDEDGTSGGGEEHFYRVNVVPYWELNGDRLSKSDDCRAESARTAAQITDDDCIVTQLGYTATIRFHNVIKDQFNVYVHVNGTQVITEPGNTALAGPFTLDLQDGDNTVRVRLASKTGTHFSEHYSNDRFHYKVKATDVLVSNIGQADSTSTAIINNTAWRAQRFTTGPNESGYSVSKIVVNFRADVSGTFTFAVHETDSTGTTVVPGTKVADLTGAPTSSGEHSFTPSAPMLLDASTDYFIVFGKSTNQNTNLQRTNSSSEDPGPVGGWSIDDGSLLSANAGRTWNTADCYFGNRRQGGIEGSVVRTPP